jgi:hypothetical protein
MGEDGEVASSALLAENQAGYLPSGKGKITVLDLHTNKVVYEAVGKTWQKSMSQPMYISWLDNDTFRITGVNGTTDTLIRIEDNTPQVLAEFPLDSTSVSPDNQFLLVEDTSNPLSVYDVYHNQLIPVIERPLPQGLQIEASWHDAQFLLLIVKQDDVVLARWIAQIA